MNNMEESCTIEEALDYVKRYPIYLKCRDELEHQRKFLFISGNMQKIAHTEQLLCKLTPWNVSEVQEEVRLYEFDARELQLPRSVDLHAAGDFGQEFMDALKVLIKEITGLDEISKRDQDTLERGALVVLYDILHRNKKWGRLFFGKERNKFVQGDQNEVDELMGKVNSDSAMGIIRLLDYKGGWSEFYHNLWKDKEGDLSSIYKYHHSSIFNSDFRREMTSVVAFGQIIETERDEESKIDSADMPCFFALVQQARRSPFAKYAIGYCYSKGLFVKQDKEKAKLWTQWSASEGCLYAQLTLKEDKQ